MHSPHKVRCFGDLHSYLFGSEPVTAGCFSFDWLPSYQLSKLDTSTFTVMPPGMRFTALSYRPLSTTRVLVQCSLIAAALKHVFFSSLVGCSHINFQLRMYR